MFFHPSKSGSVSVFAGRDVVITAGISYLQLATLDEVGDLLLFEPGGKVWLGAVVGGPHEVQVQVVKNMWAQTIDFEGWSLRQSGCWGYQLGEGVEGGEQVGLGVVGDVRVGLLSRRT